MPRHNIEVTAELPTPKTIIFQVDADNPCDALRKALTQAKRSKEWPVDVTDLRCEVVQQVARQAALIGG